MGMENGKRVEFKNNAIDLLFDFLGNLAKKIRGIEKSHQDIIKAQNEEDVLFNAVVTGDFKALVPKPEAEKPETTDLGLGETEDLAVEQARQNVNPFGNKPRAPEDQFVDENGEPVNDDEIAERIANGGKVMRRKDYEAIQRQGETDEERRIRLNEERQRLRQSETMDGELRLLTPDGEMSVNATYAIVDIDSLITSSDEGYDQKLQPRDRSTQSSQEQIEKIGRDPVFERIAESPTTDADAPIVTTDGQVLSGNGRVLGLRKAVGYLSNKDYETKAREFASQHKIDISENVKHPVLVRVLSKEYDHATLEQVAERSNRPQFLARNDAETAEADGKMLRDTRLISLFDGGENVNIHAASNVDFVTAFVHQTGDTSILDSAGRITAMGAKRIERALLAAVVGGHAHGREIVREAIEQGDALGINTIIAGIIKSAQDLLSLDRGVMGKDYSLLTVIGDALNEYIVFAKEKADGKWDNIEDYLAQQDFFSSRAPLTEEIMRQLFTRRQSAKRVAAVFSYYANMAEEQEGISDGLFAGEMEATPKEEIWRRAVEAVTADENNEALDERLSIVGTWNGSNGDVRYSIGTKRKEQMRQGLKTKLTHATDEQVEATITAIEEMGERVKAGGDPKTEKVAFHWAMQGTIILPEDEPKVLQAIKVSSIAKVDPLQYNSPMELINTHTDIKIKEKPIDPDTVPELSNKKTLAHGITVYDVQDDKAGQAAMRKIINTHFGEDCSPWCLLQGDGKGGLSEDAWMYWSRYGAIQKRVAFKNGKLLAFCARNDEVTWWDKQDRPHKGIPIAITQKKPNDPLGRSATYDMDEETVPSYDRLTLLKSKHKEKDSEEDATETLHQRPSS